VKREPSIQVVIPAKAGIHFALVQKIKVNMDSRFRGNDGAFLNAALLTFWLFLAFLVPAFRSICRSKKQGRR
jgi:hypothetical protein